MDTQTEKELKQAMGYVGETESCACCKNYRAATDGVMYGGPQQEPKGERCGLNVIEVPVSAGGRCNRFKRREPLAQLSKHIESL